MQPPAISTYLHDQIRKLRLEAETQCKNNSKINATISISALHLEKINKWILSLPKSQQERRYSIEEIVRLAELNGKFRPSPSRSDVADALRKAGFSQQRSWKKNDRNKRFWSWNHSHSI